MITPKDIGLGLGKDKAISLIADKLNRGLPTSADAVDETSSKQFVSEEDKYTWNAKIDEAPTDGQKYIRQDGVWLVAVNPQDVLDNHTNLLDPHPQYLSKQEVGDQYLTKSDANSSFVSASTLGQPGGVATLDDSGSIPLDMLPEIAAGRKINVENAAERFALDIYPDLTIVYESDTGEAFALNANEDPSESANWSKLGNAEAIGITSFNSRTGNVVAESGDYSTSQITEDGAKLFVTPSEKSSWNSKETPEGAQAKTDALKNYVEATFATKDSSSVKDAAQDILINESVSKNTLQDLQIQNLQSSKADLINGVVPFSQLPDLPVGRKVSVVNQAARLALPVHPDLTIAYEADTGEAWALNAGASTAVQSNWTKLGNAQVSGVKSFNGRIGNVGPQSGDYSTNQLNETVDKYFLTPAITAQINAKETPAGAQSKADAAVNMATTNAKTYADDTFIPLSQKNTDGGVAPLGPTGKVPILNLPVNVADGIPSLGSDGKIPVAQMPSHLPAYKRIWRNAKPQRNVDTYVTHNSVGGNELMVYVRTASSSDTTRELRGRVRESPTGPWFQFQSDVFTSGGNRWQHLYLHVPSGWQYAILSTGGTNNSNIDSWFEMY